MAHALGLSVASFLRTIIQVRSISTEATLAVVTQASIRAAGLGLLADFPSQILVVSARARESMAG